MSPIIYDEEENDEDMTSNMRVEFHERWCKRLSESIAVNSTTSKKACSEPAPNPPSIPALSTTVKGHELPEVHDVIEQVARSIIHS